MDIIEIGEQILPEYTICHDKNSMMWDTGIISKGNEQQQLYASVGIIAAVVVGVLLRLLTMNMGW